MNQSQPISKEELFSRLPPIWPDASLREKIAQAQAESRRCVVALDDDPTGTQTVHHVWVLTRWREEDLRGALGEDEPAFYILTNSRSLPLAEAQSLNHEVASHLSRAAQETRRPLTVVSRSDSTLRGHFPGEVDALSKTLAEVQGNSFDGICLIPFFPEGGRFTIDDTHWVQEGEQLIPAACTPYARDPVFGYSHSRLQDWVEEKTRGKIQADKVISVSLNLLRLGGPDEVASQLWSVQNNQVIVVNAAHDRDLEVFAYGLLQAEASGKRFLFRTAASFVKIAAGIADQPLLSSFDLVNDRPLGGGLIVFGSFVPKSSAQLKVVRTLPNLEAVELPVAGVLNSATRKMVINHSVKELNRALSLGQDALVYTSRELVTGSSQEDSLSIGKRISSAFTEIIQRVEPEPRFIIGKGGITSSDLATEGMKVRVARVLGQVKPGIPVWKLGEGSRWPGLPFVIFPGNVGDDHTMAEILKILRS